MIGDDGHPPEIPIISQSDAERFSKTRNPQHGPSLENFKIDLSAPKSEWNKRLAVVFSEDFIRLGLGTNQGDVAEVFLTHIKTSRQKVLKSRTGNFLTQLDNTKMAAREMRRRGVSMPD